VATILLVEDDELVRITTAELMRDLGYVVVESESAESAMLALTQNRIDVLVTDIGLPGESGEVFAAEARAVRPGIRIVFVTGGHVVPDMSGDASAPGLLRKPFDRETLAAALARATR
jgi:DNA-binding NtrC family response regulator